MGMFDSVYIKCPSCDTQIEFQSKSGECCLSRYNGEAPLDVAHGVIGDKEKCPKCGITVKVKDWDSVTMIKLKGVEVEEDNNRNTRGFTFVEVMVVLVIVGVLLAVAIPKFKEAVAKERATTSTQSASGSEYSSGNTTWAPANSSNSQTRIIITRQNALEMAEISGKIRTAAQMVGPNDTITIIIN